MLPKIKIVIMRCNCDGEIYEEEDGRIPEFETKAVLFTWFRFYFAFPYGKVEHADHRGEWGLK